MDLKEFKSNVSLQLASQPQKQAKASQAIASLEAGIAELSALGYRIAVVEEMGTHSAPTPDEFPKMLYRRGEYPTEITVEDADAESDARGKGYSSLGEESRPVPQPAVNSEPVATMTAPDGYIAPKPAVTDKDALQRNIDNGVGASTPSQPAASAEAKVAGPGTK